MSTRNPHDPRLPYALDYLTAGRAVFVLARNRRPLANCQPCRAAQAEGGHDPAACTCLTCHGFYAATHDPDRARAMLTAHPSGLLAIATGAISGLVVIDVDPRNGGRIDPDLMPRTMLVTTPRGGWHLYYAHPGGAPIPSRELPGWTGVDVKADGGLVVAPPSALRTGGAYRYVTSSPLEPSEMPRPLLDACRAEPRDAPPAPLTTARRPAPDGPDPARGAGGIKSPAPLLAALLDTIRRAPKGQRRVTLYGCARGVARIVAAGGLTPADAWQALIHAARQARPGKPERENRAAILGAFRDEGVPITPLDGARGAA